MSTYYVPSTPPFRGRAYSFGQPASYPYQGTPYSPYNPLPAVPYYGPSPRDAMGSAAYYVAPSVSGRSRSHSRPRHSHTHHRSHHGHHHSHRRSQSHNGRSRQHRSNGHVRVSTTPPCLHLLTRPETQHTSYRYPNTVTSTSGTYYREAPSLGSRILSFFGLGNSNRDRYGRSYDSRGRY